MICEKKHETKGLVMILGLSFFIGIFGGFDAYHVFDELLEKIAFVVTFPNCLDLGLELICV